VSEDPWAPPADLRAGLYIVAVLAVAGAVLGVVWKVWSPPGPLGYVIAPHAVQADETEAFVAADGRFAVITALTGIVAAVAVWFAKPVRGPVAALALGIGSLLGTLLTEVVGHALAGGHSSGPANTFIKHLPLSVHMTGLRLLEAAVAVLVYGLFVAFAASDDLGRPGSSGLVVDGQQPQDGWGHGYGAGALEQPYLPPQ
jgi:hypothetical protein